MEIETATGGKLKKEIVRIKTQYALYDMQRLSETIWSPFNEGEVAYRSQQLLAFAALMRQIGRSDLSGLRILDVGSGRGRILRTFLDMGAKAEDLFGVDLIEAYVVEARQISPQLNFSVTDGTILAFLDASFDLVTQYVVFSSIALPALRQQLANEMWRVLKPGGYVFWWDMLHVAAEAGGHDRPLDPCTLFLNVPVKKLYVRMRPAPSECLRPLRGIRRILGLILDGLGYPVTHLAALFGPKP